MAPVFNLQEMLEAEAEKLRMKVEQASLMAAKAAEEAEEKVKMIAQEAMKESGANAMDEEEVEEIVSCILIYFYTRSATIVIGLLVLKQFTMAF